MRKKTCPMEEQVVGALKKTEVAESIEKHIKECPVCREVAYIYRWMNQFKRAGWEEKMEGKVLPDADVIWKRMYAGQRRRRELVRKALRPLVIPQVLSYGVLIFGAVFLLVSRGKDIGDFLSGKLAGFTELFPYFFIPLAGVLVSMLVCAFASALDKRFIR